MNPYNAAIARMVVLAWEARKAGDMSRAEAIHECITIATSRTIQAGSETR